MDAIIVVKPSEKPEEVAAENGYQLDELSTPAPEGEGRQSYLAEVEPLPQ